MISILKISLLMVSASFTTLSCDEYESPERMVQEEKSTKLFVEQFDPIRDEGQYWHPQSLTKPALYWNCVEVFPIGNINALGQTERIRGLQYHLLAQSLAGLSNRAVEQGKSQVGVWLNDHSGKASYKSSKQALSDMGVAEIGMQSAIELATRNYGEKDGINLKIKDLFDGYVLTDVENNPESNIVASVASHVYNSIIVDIRDKNFYESNGYTMTYDASQKTTVDAWNEFKDKCNNKALVVMPVQTGELREFAIKNNLFVINLNKRYSTSQGGQNIALFEEILQWLEPNSPVYGWEQGVGEDQFVERVSKSGNIMIPYDWAYNTTLTSLDYKQRQPDLVKVKNPQFINWEEEGKKYVSFYLSDGDNVQWMMNNFIGADYYTHPEANNVKMAFGLPVDNLSMIAPSVCQDLFNSQGSKTSIVQTFGGGYNYIDNYGEKKSRHTILKSLAEGTAAHMRQHRVKVLAVMAKDVSSAASAEAYQAYIDANDQLEGIISVQYTPYAGGKGEIMWFTNGNGYDIPVVTVKYSIWDFGGYNNEREGTPDHIANKLIGSSDSDPFNLVIVHAWSGFNETGTASGGIKGAGAAKLCADKLNQNYAVVNIEEMIWRIRMHHRPEQTQKYLDEVF
ncbi:GxGYxY sequence motif-containing protein [Saccharicrinis carchari]|uniref:GxGYxY sequence motif-containing protein n=2 Tax=Saccharicrinis carchari TaxID=1168039 RepID=A0A521F1B5_SACCC|nr:GxGYxY sequence motif-containing protein [Saccharicrinis carchari]